MLVSIGRRTGLLLATVAAALVVFGGVALAAAISCKAGVVCYGTSYDDVMTGTDYEGEFQPNNDDMRGLAGNDILRALKGNDKLNGGSGNDKLDGGDGSDSYVFENGWGVDVITDASNYNQLDFSKYTYAVSVDLIPDSNSKIAYGGTDSVGLSSTTTRVVDRVFGGAGNDSIRGSNQQTGDERLWGGQGNDYIYGRAGYDWLYGQDGDDFVNGQSGSDNIWGDAGNDTIYVSGDGERDYVTCGAGYDTVYYDSGLDFVHTDCEALRPASPFQQAVAAG